MILRSYNIFQQVFGIANLLFLPLSGKLKNKSDEEIIIREMIIEGVLAIQYGEHPHSVERLLSNFIPPEKRKKPESTTDK